MRDGLGVGLAATQIGILRRLLVFQAGPDSEPSAIVNPEIEWLSERGGDRRGGLPQHPAGLGRRRAPALRAGQRVRYRGRADQDRGIGARGEGAPARDRPSRRRPDPRSHHPRAAQGRHCAPCARAGPTAPRTGRSPRRARPRGRPPPRREPQRLPRHLRVRGDGARGPLRLAPPPLAWSSRPLRGRAAGVASRRRPRPRRGRASSESSCSRPPTSTEPESLEAILAAGSRARLRLRLRPADPRAAALAAADAQPASLAAARAGGARRRSSGRSWPATLRPGVCVIRVEEGLDSGPIALCERTPIATREDYGSLSGRLEEIGGRLLLRALDLAAAGRDRVQPPGHRRGHATPRRSPRPSAGSILRALPRPSPGRSAP